MSDISSVSSILATASPTAAVSADSAGSVSAGENSSVDTSSTESSSSTPAYSLSDSLINLINGSYSAKTSDSLLNNVYSSLSTLNAASKLSSSTFQKMQDLNSTDTVKSYTSQISTLFSSLNKSSGGISSDTYQALLSGSLSASKFSVMLAGDSSGTILSNAISQMNNSNVNIFI